MIMGCFVRSAIFFGALGLVGTVVLPAKRAWASANDTHVKAAAVAADADDDTDDDKPQRHTYKYSLIGMDRHQYLVGGVTSTVVGYGIGHAVQGRYWQDGWVFTAGELAANVLTAVSIAPCRDDFFSTSDISINKRLGKCNKAGLIAAPLIFVGFRIWETVDAWLTPNPDLKEHLFGRERKVSSLQLSYAPPFQGGLGSLNLSYSF